ncbi:ubiquitinyl hydrolase 1 [Salvia divinorum]|uniref:Ubiquitinyl hydrolase 1 n=1 Tax=Salvia divinorum TaxID=28513 RepID=A0ABD1GNB3_SALDI
MDDLFFSNNDHDHDLFSNTFDQSFLPPSFADPGESLYLVSFRWWKEAAWNLWREEEASTSGEEANYDGEGDLALVSEWMFFTALKWHYDKKGMENSLPGEDSGHGLFSLQIRLMHVRETRQLVIKISQEDNDHRSFNKAYCIFTTLGMLQVQDFSRHTNQFFLNESLSSVDLAQSHEEAINFFSL